MYILSCIASNPVLPKKVRGGAKASKTAAKVAFMKMKMHAQGDASCPLVERVYLTMCLPLRCKKGAVPTFFSKVNFSFFSLLQKVFVYLPLTHHQTTNFRLFQTERVCRRQFQILQKWHKVIQTGRKHCGKRRNCSLRAISPFPTVFSKGLFSRGIKRCHCMGMG